MLLDTCFGARVTKSSEEGVWIKETLSATGFHDSDLAPAGPSSFTQCLVKALESGLGGQTPTVYNLHVYRMSRAMGGSRNHRRLNLFASYQCRRPWPSGRPTTLRPGDDDLEDDDEMWWDIQLNSTTRTVYHGMPITEYRKLIKDGRWRGGSEDTSRTWAASIGVPTQWAQREIPGT
jgi:hypothetical protein